MRPKVPSRTDYSRVRQFANSFSLETFNDALVEQTRLVDRRNKLTEESYKSSCHSSIKLYCSPIWAGRNEGPLCCTDETEGAEIERKPVINHVTHVAPIRLLIWASVLALS